MENYINKVSQIEKPMFFLFTCVKDGRNYVHNLFDSLLNQKLTNFIHYIYEDGSDEPLGEIVDEYIKSASELAHPFKVIYEKCDVNIGLNLATKHCISKCTCPYFIWIDCDNWINKDFFYELTKTVKKNKGLLMIRTNCQTIDENGNTIKIINQKKAKKVNQLLPFLYNDYPYCFFAVKYKEYMDSCNNYMFKDRIFFNDVQVISNCLFTKPKTGYSEGAISSFLFRGDSESNLDANKNLVHLYNLMSELAVATNHIQFSFVKYMPDMITLYKKMIVSYYSGLYCESMRNFFLKLRFAKKNKIPFKYRNRYWTDLIWFVKIQFLLVKKPYRWIKKQFR